MLRMVKPESLGFSPELQHVLDAATRSVARELGRQAAREAFEKMTGRKVS